MHQATRADPGAGHEAAELAQSLGTLGDRRGHRILAAHVALQTDHLGRATRPRLGGNRVGPVGVDVERRHRGGARGSGERRGAADAGPGPGDHHSPGKRRIRHSDQTSSIMCGQPVSGSASGYSISSPTSSSQRCATGSPLNRSTMRS